jgi:ribonucleotide reductase beta subunit family protein with ferritin-like domain
MTDTQEEILSEISNRFVLFPIRYTSIWNMYKKAESVFWTAEEIDLSKDLSDWEKLSENERYFIKHILAFFAGSDGIVNENLGVRFMNDVKIPEAKAFYGFQIAMENIHCVSADTKVLTKNGYIPIKDIAGKVTSIWNGVEWSEVTPYHTGKGKLYRVTLSNGMFLDCTSKHKWFIDKERDPVFTESLTTGMKIKPFQYPSDQSIDDYDVFTAPFKHGESTCKENYDRTRHDCRPHFFVPMNYSTSTRIKWLNGFLSNVPISLDGSLHINHPCKEFLQNVQLLLTLLSINSTVTPTSITIPSDEQKKMWWHHNTNIEDIQRIQPNLTVTSIDLQEGDEHDTYCFDEPQHHAGVFNGILTGQSETYSLLIDTYIKDTHEKYRLFNAINTIPCIAKKADWAMRWIQDKDASFAKRLVAFACVEGIFFSGAFCAIFWLKERGVLSGLCLSNEFISRDEGLHTEFAVLLYSMLKNKLSYDVVSQIVKEAVEIEDEFINESIPCNLLGMNASLMSQYIKFVADRLLVQLGYPKIWNTTNPFHFMDRICLENKTNFFEDRVAQYSKANVGGSGQSNYEFSTDVEF